ncbi:MAG TPA: hypothetical protein DIU00_20125 [Phycisphaerales bacterium]|nr:hypothetical protein [Phycisphaerales bacterium]
MINGILARMFISVGGVLMGLLVIAAYVFIFALIIICLVRVSRYFRNAGKEQKLIRMELGKMAEEVHLLRQEIKDGKNGDAST